MLASQTTCRRVAAMSVAKRVSEEVGCRLGEEVGAPVSRAGALEACLLGALGRRRWYVRAKEQGC